MPRQCMVLKHASYAPLDTYHAWYDCVVLNNYQSILHKLIWSNQELAITMGIPFFIETSAKDDINVKQLFETIARDILKKHHLEGNDALVLRPIITRKENNKCFWCNMKCFDLFSFCVISYICVFLARNVFKLCSKDKHWIAPNECHSDLFKTASDKYLCVMCNNWIMCFLIVNHDYDGTYLCLC